MGVAFCDCSTPSKTNENVLLQESKTKQTNCQRRNDSRNDREDCNGNTAKQNNKMRLQNKGNVSPHNGSTTHLAHNNVSCSSELEIFTLNGNDCFGDGTIDIHKCDHIHRLSLAMKHCHSLNLQTNHTNHSQFAAFCETYTQALNDYNHFMTVHSHQIEEVNRQMENDKQF
eukprot:48244_1